MCDGRDPCILLWLQFMNILLMLHFPETLTHVDLMAFVQLQAPVWIFGRSIASTSPISHWTVASVAQTVFFARPEWFKDVSNCWMFRSEESKGRYSSSLPSIKDCSSHSLNRCLCFSSSCSWFSRTYSLSISSLNLHSLACLWSSQNAFSLPVSKFVSYKCQKAHLSTFIAFFENKVCLPDFISNNIPFFWGFVLCAST